VEGGDHAGYSYVQTRDGKFVAVCSCGWRSEPSYAAGLAGAAWDRHKAEVLAEETAT
jgi:hypothetical protein